MVGFIVAIKCIADEVAPFVIGTPVHFVCGNILAAISHAMQLIKLLSTVIFFQH